MIRPQGILSEAVQCFWISRSPEASVPAEYLLLPDGITEIIFNLGEPERIIDGRNGDSLGIFNGSQLIVKRKDPLLLKQAGGKYKIGIRFLPGGLYPFLQIPLDRISESMIDLKVLIGDDCMEMEERLFHAKNTGEVIDVLRKKLLSRFNPGFLGDRIVKSIIHRILVHPGEFSLKKLSDCLGMNPKTLRRKFVSRVGLTPKFFSQIIRFRSLVRKMEERGSSSWASVIYDYGFYDQSHFIKEFKFFSGMTPNLFFSRSPKLIR